MFNKIKEFFTGKPAEVVAEAPYKVEVAVAPVVPVADSTIVIAEQASQAMVESVAPEKKKPAAKKAPAAKKPAVKKPRAPKAPKV